MQFNPLPLAEFLKEQSMESSWLIRHLWKRGGFTLVSGPPKMSRKSFLVELMALCLAYFVRASGIEPTERAKVLYVGEEGPKTDAQDRLRAHCMALNVDPNGAENYFFMMHLSGFRLFERSHMDALLAWCDEHNPNAVILDPWSKVGPDDADSTEASLMCMQSVSELQRRGLSVVVVCHTAKLDPKNRRDIDVEVRGSSVLVGAYDTHIALRPMTEGLPIPCTVRNKNASQREATLVWDMVEEHHPQRNEKYIAECSLDWRDKE